MYTAACIEWLFAAEHPEMADRIHAAAAAGLRAVEFHLWRNKELEPIREALQATGLELTSIVVEPRRSLVDPAQHGEFLQAVAESLPVAARLRARSVVVASGFTREGVSREEQHAEAAGVLARAAAMAGDAGVGMLLEPLNTRVDHPGMFLCSTAEGLDLIDEVASPHLKLLYDYYHMSVMEEPMEPALAGRIDRVGHVHFADLPGRQEPGTGGLPWAEVVATLERLGYDGPIGLEYRPSGPTLETLQRTRDAIGFL